VRELEGLGLLILQDTPIGYRMLLPFVLAHAWNSRLYIHIFPTGILTFLPSAFYQSFEFLGSQFEILKNNCFFLSSSTDEVKTTFGERFSGALMHSSLRSRPLVLHKMIGFVSETDQLSSPEVKVVGRDRPVNITQESACILIGRNNTTCDVLSCYPHQNNDESFIKADEWKSSFSHMEHKIPPSLDLKEIKEEEDNAYNGLAFVSKDSKIFFCLMTNRRAPAEAELYKLEGEYKLLPTTMVVGSEQWTEYFSYMFASLIPRTLRQSRDG
jgi:hypothetical protein